MNQYVYCSSCYRNRKEVRLERLEKIFPNLYNVLKISISMKSVNYAKRHVHGRPCTLPESYHVINFKYISRSTRDEEKYK